MWQLLVAQFDHVAAFKALWRKTSAKDGAHMCSEDAYVSLRSRISPALNGSSVLQRFERGNVVKIRNGTMFDFYPRMQCHSCTQNQLRVQRCMYIWKAIQNSVEY